MSEATVLSTGSPIRTVVVPLDGSILAQQAVKIAAVIARQCDARLVLIHIHEPPRLAMAHAYDWDKEIRRREIAYLCRIATRTREIGDMPIERFVLDGHPADAICSFAAQRESPLLVMASHGRTGASRLWIGSVTDAVLTRSHVPVLMVRVDGGRASPPSVARRILVALDGSVVAEQILSPAMTIADALGARVDLIRVVEPGDVPSTTKGLAEDVLGAVVRQATSELEDVASSIVDDHPSVPVGVLVHVAQSPAATIVAAAAAHGCDVVAMTTRSRGLRRAILGSVADKVVRAGPALILLARPREVARSDRVGVLESDEVPTGGTAQGSRKSRTDENAVAVYPVSQQTDPPQLVKGIRRATTSTTGGDDVKSKAIPVCGGHRRPASLRKRHWSTRNGAEPN